MIELNKNGETAIQKQIYKIIYNKVNLNFYNKEQLEAIKTIWGLSQNPKNKKSKTNAKSQKKIIDFGANLIEPIIGEMPNDLKYKNEIPDSHQIFSGSVIIGPPGTGKTVIIVEGSLLFISKPQYSSSKKAVIFIATPNNESAQRVLEGFHKFFDENQINNGSNYVKLIFPKKTRTDFEAHLRQYIIEHPRPKNYQEEEYKKLISRVWIFIGTVHQFIYLNQRYKINPQIVIFDEASQITPPMMFLPFIGNIRGFCLVGDNQQLPPITSFSELSTNAIDFLLKRLSFGQQNLPNSRQITLKIQYRMHPAIRDLSTRLIPGRDIIQDGENTKENNYLLDLSNKYNGLYFENINEIINPNKTIIILNTSELSEAENHKSGTSRYNICEIEIIKGLVKLLKNAFNSFEKDDFLKIITPYRIQADKLRTYYYKSGTADIFQGQEADIAIISLTLTDTIPSPHIRDRNRLHVMFSRARKKLIIIGNEDTFKSEETKASHIKNIFQYKYDNESNPELGYDPVYKLNISQDFFDFLKNQ
ncbi:MAG: DEAD/DEAH box helicase [Promethearchaeota archaeon]